MIRLFKYLRGEEIVMFTGLLVFLVAQIFCDVTMPTYTAQIVAQMQQGAAAAEILRCREQTDETCNRQRGK